MLNYSTNREGVETMTIYQVYEQTIKPLSTGEKLTIARLIINDVAPDDPDGAVSAEAGFDYLHSILPQIERITLTDEDLATVTLNGPSSQ